MKKVFVLFLISILTLGCENNRNENFFLTAESEALSYITGPSGSALNTTPGVAYSFNLTISGVNGVGSFSSDFGSTTGPVTLTGLEITFSPLTPTGTPTEFTCVGTFSAPFPLLDQGTVMVTVVYSEPGILILNNKLTFKLKVIPSILASFEFSPSSPFEVASRQDDSTITVINATPPGGTISLSNINDGGTGGTFILGTGLNFIFSTSTTTAVGVASVDVTYNPPAPDVPFTQTFIVNVAPPIFIHPFELSSADGANATIFRGISPSDSTARSVTTGDINGDGIKDLIISAFTASPNGNNNAGQTYIVFGSTTPFSASQDLSTLDGMNGFTVNGLNPSDFSSFSASAGDINGDGIEDLIIASPGASPNGNMLAGEIYVIFGNTTPFPALFDLTTLDGMNGFTVNGIIVGGFAGFFVSAGDINGDGIEDLLIGAPGASPNGNTSAGATYVVFGSTAPFSTSLELSTIDGSNGFIVNGIDVEDFSGRLLSAGDINGDGIKDLLISTPSADPNGNIDAGETYVVFGSTAPFSALLELSNLNGMNGFIVNGIATYDNSGNSVSAGDINGDGIEDLLIGAPLAAPNGISSAGETYIVFGSNAPFSASLELSTLDGSNGFTVDATTIGFQSGFSVSTGDINNDGIEDVIIGSPMGSSNGIPAAGQTHVVFGSTAPFSTSLELNTLNGSNGFTVNGISPFYRSGSSVSAGDFNGDGIDDLIIGAVNSGGIGEVAVVLNALE